MTSQAEPRLYKFVERSAISVFAIAGVQFFATVVTLARSIMGGEERVISKSELLSMLYVFLVSCAGTAVLVIIGLVAMLLTDIARNMRATRIVAEAS